MFTSSWVHCKLSLLRLNRAHTRSPLERPDCAIRDVPLHVALQVLLPLGRKITHVALERLQVRVFQLVCFEVFPLLRPVTTAWPLALERPLAAVGCHVPQHMPRGVGDIVTPWLSTRPDRTLAALAANLAGAFADGALNIWYGRPDGCLQGFAFGAARNPFVGRDAIESRGSDGRRDHRSLQQVQVVAI